MMQLNLCRKRLQALAVLASLVLLVCLPAAATSPTPEYRLKAALIYKLTKFVSWPDSPQLTAQKYFNICLLGNDRFGEALDLLESKSVHAKAIKIYRFKQSDSVDVACQMLFIDTSKKAFEVSILKKLGAEPVLTLGETEQFAENGGMIQFTVEGKRIGFKINDNQAKLSKLKISAPLLQLATIVETTE